jgi:hypothetical protein
VNKTRRTLLYALGTGAIAVPLSTLTRQGMAFAAETPKLDPEEPSAKNLGYVHQSSDPARRCSGCQFYTGVTDAEWGPCVIFPDKVVSTNGVCNSWFAKAG